MQQRVQLRIIAGGAHHVVDLGKSSVRQSAAGGSGPSRLAHLLRQVLGDQPVGFGVGVQAAERADDVAFRVTPPR